MRSILEFLQRKCDFWGPIDVLLDDVHLVELKVVAELRTLLLQSTARTQTPERSDPNNGPLPGLEAMACVSPSITGDFAQLRIRTHVDLQGTPFR